MQGINSQDKQMGYDGSWNEKGSSKITLDKRGSNVFQSY
jgi:hypothetical protein